MPATADIPAASEAVSAPTRTPGPSPSLVEQAVGRYRAFEKQMARMPPARMLAAVPRTGRFVGKTIARGRSDGYEGPPVPGLSAGLLANVAMDEAVLLAFMGPNRFPRRADYERARAELAEARDLYQERGFLDDPGTYHQTPPVLERPRISGGWAIGQGYEHLRFDSGFVPHPGEPGGERWSSYEPNATASAWVLRHRGEPRPWLVCLHGFGMGPAFMAFTPFQVKVLHHDLGLNLIGPTLPLHGPRSITRMSGEAFLSFDMMNSVHGLAQSVWDVRRLLSWVRGQDPVAVGVYGISLGAYVASLLATVDDGLDAVIAGVPVSDFPALYHSHAPTNIRMRVIENQILGGTAEAVHRVVSPLARPVLVPHASRFIYAGHGDRMSHPRQAWNLWKHWDEPSIEWYPGSHVGFLWSGQVHDYVRGALVRTGLSNRSPTP